MQGCLRNEIIEIQ